MKVLSFVLCALLLGCAGVQKSPELVATTPNEIHPLINGLNIPSTKVKNVDGIEVDLVTELKGQNTVLVFYRGGWCPYCNLQLQGLRKIEKKLKKLGWKVVGISPDSASSMKESIKNHNLKYTLYSDSSVNAAINFGLAYKVSDATNDKLLGYNINIEKASGETHRILPVPGVYLINSKGKIVFNYINPNYKVRLKESVILQAAKELK
jgi:peroxiredoxin